MRDSATPRRVLVVAGSPSLSASVVSRLAATVDLVVAADGGGAACLDCDVIPDVLVGDFDSLSATDLERFEQAAVDIRRFPVLKDQTDLELAFDAVRQAGAGEVLVTGALGERLDHSMAALELCAAHADLSPQLIEEDVIVVTLSPGGRSSVELSAIGATVSLIAAGGDAVVSAESVRWPLDRAVLSAAHTLGISNVITGDVARVTVHEGVAFVVCPTVDGIRATTDSSE